MRRFVFILLMAILPIQFSWAAVTSYCRHETGNASNHFGHHQHQHRAAPDDASKDQKADVPAGADNDCGTCHLSGAQTIAGQTSSVFASEGASPLFEFGWLYDSHISSGPERPDRPAPTPAVRFGGAVVIGSLLLIVSFLPRGRVASVVRQEG